MFFLQAIPWLFVWLNMKSLAFGGKRRDNCGECERYCERGILSKSTAIPLYKPSDWDKPCHTLHLATGIDISSYNAPNRRS